MKTNASWIEELFLKVDDHFSKGEFPEGKKILEELLESEPGFGKAHNHLGWLYFAKLDDYEKAEYHYGLAIRFDPMYPAGYLNMAHLLLFMSRHTALIEHTEKALTVEGVNKNMLYTLMGRSYEVNEHYKQATQAYKMAIRYALNKQEMDTLLESMERLKTKNGLIEKRFFFF